MINVIIKYLLQEPESIVDGTPSSKVFKHRFVQKDGSEPKFSLISSTQLQDITNAKFFYRNWMDTYTFPVLQLIIDQPQDQKDQVKEMIVTQLYEQKGNHLFFTHEQLGENKQIPKLELPDKSVLQMAVLTREMMKSSKSKFSNLKDFNLKNVEDYVNAAGVVDQEVYTKIIESSPHQLLTAKNFMDKTALE